MMSLSHLHCIGMVFALPVRSFATRQIEEKFHFSKEKKDSYIKKKNKSLELKLWNSNSETFNEILAIEDVARSTKPVVVVFVMSLHIYWKEALAIRRIFSLVDMITKAKFLKSPNDFEIRLFG